jgi:hypothetical protein
MAEAANIQTSNTSSATRLCKAINRCDEIMKPFRQQHAALMKEYAGPYYGKTAPATEADARPLAMIYSLIGVLLPHLVIDPEVMAGTQKMDLRLFGGMLEARINAALRECGFAETNLLVVTDALATIGITKTGLGPPGTRGFPEAGNWLSDPGEVYVRRVSNDDWVFDVDAKERGARAFEGNRYEVPYEWAMNSPLFPNKPVLEKIKSSEAGAKGSAKTAEAVRGKPRDDQRFIDYVQLLDVWLPQHNMVVTLPSNVSDASGYVAEREYIGPEAGPYDEFGLAPVPDYPLPAPLIGNVYDLYILMNKVARKIGRQAERQKSVGLYSLGHEGDADAVRDAPDGTIVGVTDAEMFKEFNLGGPADVNYRAVAWMRDFFNVVSRNPELLGGLGPQSPTLGQDEMNKASAGMGLGFWRRRMVQAASSVARKVAWWAWTDKLSYRDLVITTETGVEVPVRWSPKTREGDFLDFNIEIDMFSRRTQDPDERYRRLVEYLERIVLPLAEIGAPQGMLLDVQQTARLAGRFLGIREADWIFRHGQPIEMSRGRTRARQGQYADNRQVRRLPAKPPPVESQAEQAGVV